MLQDANKEIFFAFPPVTRCQQHTLQSIHCMKIFKKNDNIRTGSKDQPDVLF